MGGSRPGRRCCGSGRPPSLSTGRACAQEPQPGPDPHRRPGRLGVRYLPRSRPAGTSPARRRGHLGQRPNPGRHPKRAQTGEPWEDAEPAIRRYDPLAASIDYILPRSRGGTDDDGNLQITHLRCNLLKHDQAQPPPEYAKARLSLTLDGTPVPFGVWRHAVPPPRRGTPAARRARKLPPPWMVDRRQVAVEPWRLITRYRVWRMLGRYRRRRQAAHDAFS